MSNKNTINENLKNLSKMPEVGFSESLKKALTNLQNVDLRTVMARPIIELPKIEKLNIPSYKDQNSYQSASILIKKLAERVTQWRAEIAEDMQPVIVAILQGGVQINVTTLAEESFHGVRIEGTFEGSPCMVLTHQASIQMLCYVERVQAISEKRGIGFIIAGEPYPK